jgi:hypothetical protein
MVGLPFKPEGGGGGVSKVRPSFSATFQSPAHAREIGKKHVPPLPSRPLKKYILACAIHVI